MFKRIGLFIATNIAVVALFSIVASIFGIGNLIQGNELQLQNLFFFALFFGFAGSIISLLLSKTIAKWTMSLKIIENNNFSSQQEVKVYGWIQELALKSNISMPEVAIYNSPEPNAFATGPTKNNSLVAVSTGLLNLMDDKQVKAVLAHEIGHVANGDMVTMTLLQGVVNTFVIFFARIVAFAVSAVISRNDDGEESPISNIVFMITSFIFEIIFGLLASIIVAKYSQYREYKADEAGATLTNNKDMAGALQKLLDYTNRGGNSYMPENLKAFGISTGPKKGFSLMELFSTHPPLEKRISKLLK